MVTLAKSSPSRGAPRPSQKESATVMLVWEQKYDEAVKKSDELIELSQPILKFEWDRVKNGEPRYRLPRNSALVFLLISLALLGYLLIIDNGPAWLSYTSH
jgi:hypothetical protein